MATVPLKEQYLDCRLLQLPPDIRNIIYDFVFFEPKGISIDFTEYYRTSSRHTIFALAMTCKEIYKETRGLPYSLNVYHFQVPVLQNMESLFTTASPFSTWPVPRPDAFRESNALGQKSKQFVSSATRSPLAIDVAQSLSEAIDQTWVMSKLRRVHIHLGSQTNHTFVERFFHAWSEVDDSLCRLRARSDLRISFELRISRWLVVQYSFNVGSPEETLAEMDYCVKVDGVLTLPEISTINAVRLSVWRTFFQRTPGSRKPVSFLALSQQNATALPSTWRERAEELMHHVAFEGTIR